MLLLVFLSFRVPFPCPFPSSQNYQVESLLTLLGLIPLHFWVCLLPQRRLQLPSASLPIRTGDPLSLP